MSLQIPLLQPQALARGFGYNLRPFFEMLNDCARATTSPCKLCEIFHV